MTVDAQQPAGCPDGGTCGHRCLTGCWRVAYAEPLSIAKYPGDRWPTDVRREYSNPVQDWGPDADQVPETQADVHWGSRRGRVLRFLHQFVAEHGYPPSMREVGRAVGLTSTSSVAHQLLVLEAGGHIRRDPNSPRAITLLTPPPGTVPTAADRHCATCSCVTTEVRP